MNTHPGMFVVANYETAQPANVAWDMTPYCWIVETQYKGATDRKCAQMVADLAGRPGKKRHRQAYFCGHSEGCNYMETALAFMRAFILPEGKDARLVSMANTRNGMLFVFL